MVQSPQPAHVEFVLPETPLPGLRRPSVRFCVLTLLMATAFPLSAQTGSRRPALIRDTDTAEGKDEAAAEKEKPFNPLAAEQSMKVGDFYFKKKNYDAAIQRYMEALEYQPNLFVAYDALGRAYEKQGKPEKALRVYKDFLQKYPQSDKAGDFRERAARLQKN